MLIFFSALRSGVPVKTSFTLGITTVSASRTCGGSSSSQFMVYAIFNSKFIVGYPDSNEISVVEDGALRSVMSNFTSVRGY